MSCVTKLTLQYDVLVLMPRLGKLIQVNFLMLSAHLCWGARLLWISSSTKVFDYLAVRLTSEREIGISVDVVSQAGLLWEMVVMTLIHEMGCHTFSCKKAEILGNATFLSPHFSMQSKNLELFVFIGLL